MRFSARLSSADHGLFFEAHFRYDWKSVSSQEGLIFHGDAVARTLLREKAAALTADYPVLSADAAESAVNRALSEGIRADPRITVTGHITLAVSEHTLRTATHRAEAAESEYLREASRTARLEMLRAIMLDQGLGLVWWVDRYADLQFAAGDPRAKAESVIAAFRLVTEALRSDTARSQPDENAIIRARVEEILLALSDPQTSKRAADLLETILHTLAPHKVDTDHPEDRALGTYPHANPVAGLAADTQ
jgi:hypothetical protein